MKSLTIIFILIFSFSVFGQKEADLQAKIKTFKKDKNYSAKYDKFKDEILIRFDSFEIFPTKESDITMPVRLSAAFFNKGEIVSEDGQTFFLMFSSTSRSWAYLRNRSLIFIVDDKRLDLGDGSHDGKVSSSRYSTGVREFMTFKISRDQLKQIAESKSGEFQLGNFEAVLTDEHKEMFKNMIALSTSNLTTPTK